MKPTPKGWPRLSASVFYADAPKAIDWLCAAFGFGLRLKVEGEPGQIIHSELTYGDAVVMVCTAGRPRPDHPLFPPSSAPAGIGGVNTQAIMLYVDDAEAHHAHAKAAGATIVGTPEVHDYGPEYWADRTYGALDPEGHMWWFCERVRNPE